VNGQPRVLVCPQEFKGSLTAAAAARAIAEGVAAAVADADVRQLPLADGGPGTVDACLGAGGERIEVTVTGPLGEPVRASYALFTSGAGDRQAVIESASACGLVLVAPDRRDPSRATTYGVGELLLDALARGAGRIVVGVGGSGTNDGGGGAAQALGLRLLDESGRELDRGPLALARLARIDAAGVVPALDGVELRVAVDVTNRLLGAEGATAVYGPQKGVRDWELAAFDRALARWAELITRDLGIETADLEGAGAGGGLAVGLLAAAHAAGAVASIESGAALVAEAVGLREAIDEAELVITGEGSLDAQTGYGKTVAHVAALASEAGRPCLVVAGRVEGMPAGLTDAEAAMPPGVRVEEAMALGAAPVTAAARRLMERWIGRGSAVGG
jgi:glycerate kinase